jgi:hypothetical protein
MWPWWLAVAMAVSVNSGQVVRLGFDAQEPQFAAALPEGVVWLAKADMEPVALARAYQAALRQSPFRRTGAGFIVSAGPLLDGPDEAVFVRVSGTAGNVLLEAAHTQVRLTGQGLRRNHPYRPLLVYPFPAAEAGQPEMSVSVVWSSQASLPAGASLGPALRLGPIRIVRQN